MLCGLDHTDPRGCGRSLATVLSWRPPYRFVPPNAGFAGGVLWERSGWPRRPPDHAHRGVTRPRHRQPEGARFGRCCCGTTAASSLPSRPWGRVHTSRSDWLWPAQRVPVESPNHAPQMGVWYVAHSFVRPPPRPCKHGPCLPIFLSNPPRCAVCAKPVRLARGGALTWREVLAGKCPLVRPPLRRQALGWPGVSRGGGRRARWIEDLAAGRWEPACGLVSRAEAGCPVAAWHTGLDAHCAART